MAEEAKLLPPLDDRRRFGSLWRELLYARVLAAMAAGVLVELSGALDWQPVFTRFPAALFGVLPSAVAKRGWKVIPLTAATVVAASLVVFGVQEYTLIDLRSDLDRALLVAVFTAVGVVEGQFERSIATTMCGLMGGALSGVAAAEWWKWSHPLLPVPFGLNDRVLPSAIGLAIAHLGVGLSLALGRWVRDIPKRGRTSPDAR